MQMYIHNAQKMLSDQSAKKIKHKVHLQKLIRLCIGLTNSLCNKTEMLNYMNKQYYTYK